MLAQATTKPSVYARPSQTHSLHSLKEIYSLSGRIMQGYNSNELTKQAMEPLIWIQIYKEFSFLVCGPEAFKQMKTTTSNISAIRFGFAEESRSINLAMNCCWETFGQLRPIYFTKRITKFMMQRFSINNTRAVAITRWCLSPEILVELNQNQSD